MIDEYNDLTISGFSFVVIVLFYNFKHYLSSEFIYILYLIFLKYKNIENDLISIINLLPSDYDWGRMKDMAVIWKILSCDSVLVSVCWYDKISWVKQHKNKNLRRFMLQVNTARMAWQQVAVEKSSLTIFHPHVRDRKNERGIRARL